MGATGGTDIGKATVQNGHDVQTEVPRKKRGVEETTQSNFATIFELLHTQAELTSCRGIDLNHVQHLRCIAQ